MTFTGRMALLVVNLLLGTLAFTSCGALPTTGRPSGQGEIKITMEDFKFSPDRIQVKPGATVRFVLVNQGKVEHEIFFGDDKAQEEHEAVMAAAGGKMHEEEPGEALVEPGQTKTLEYAFPDKPGTLLYGCHVPGHWAAGMKGTVTVE